MAEPAAASSGRRSPPLRVAVGAVVLAVALGWLLVGGLLGSVTYLQPVSEAVAERDAVGDRRLRIAGEVVPGSIEVTPAGTVRFTITEGGVSVPVEHEGSPPDLFDDGIPVVSEGSWEGATFRSDRLLIRHGNEYTPRDADGDADAASPFPPR